ncbi:hypothetical protein [Vibrio sp.]|uniref:hypothetical protein n=1 Tax=Vibrio sp. TaxID=678 RepID=UPI00311DF4F6
MKDLNLDILSTVSGAGGNKPVSLIEKKKSEIRFNEARNRIKGRLESNMSTNKNTKNTQSNGKNPTNNWKKY